MDLRVNVATIFVVLDPARRSIPLKPHKGLGVFVTESVFVEVRIPGVGILSADAIFAVLVGSTLLSTAATMSEVGLKVSALVVAVKLTVVAEALPCFALITTRPTLTAVAAINLQVNATIKACC